MESNPSLYPDWPLRVPGTSPVQGAQEIGKGREWNEAGVWGMQPSLRFWCRNAESVGRAFEFHYGYFEICFKIL